MARGKTTGVEVLEPHRVREVVSQLDEKIFSALDEGLARIIGSGREDGDLVGLENDRGTVLEGLHPVNKGWAINFPSCHAEACSRGYVVRYLWMTVGHNAMNYRGR